MLIVFVISFSGSTFCIGSFLVTDDFLYLLDGVITHGDGVNDSSFTSSIIRLSIGLMAWDVGSDVISPSSNSSLRFVYF